MKHKIYYLIILLFINIFYLKLYAENNDKIEISLDVVSLDQAWNKRESKTGENYKWNFIEAENKPNADGTIEEEKYKEDIKLGLVDVLSFPRKRESIFQHFFMDPPVKPEDDMFIIFNDNF